MLLFNSSCNLWSDIWGNHTLGNNLSLWEGDNDKDKVIVYCTSQSNGACISGILVVPSTTRHMVNGKYAEYIKQVASNKKWVLAKTLQIKENKDNYYIINKSFNIENLDFAKVNCDSILQGYVIGPLTIDDYKIKKQSLSINFDFE